MRMGQAKRRPGCRLQASPEPQRGGPTLSLLLGPPLQGLCLARPLHPGRRFTASPFRLPWADIGLALWAVGNDRKSGWSRCLQSAGQSHIFNCPRVGWVATQPTERVWVARSEPEAMGVVGRRAMPRPSCLRACHTRRLATPNLSLDKALGEPCNSYGCGGRTPTLAVTRSRLSEERNGHRNCASCFDSY